MGLLLVTISLSGAGIVFYQELDRALNPSLYNVASQVTQVSLDAMVTPAQPAHPELPVWFIEAPNEAVQSYIINQKMTNGHRLQTFVNPYTGEVLGLRVWEYSFIGFLYTLHHDLFVGKVGQIIVGAVGFLLLPMTVSGILLWPGWRRLSMGLKIRWNAPLALVNYDIHKVGGIVSSLFFMITAVMDIAIVILHFLPIFNPMPEVKPTLQEGICCTR
jgi:uncharacterized iron-regulated membrane protein